MNLYVLLLTLVFIVLQLADAGTTLAILRNGGTERNPLVKYAMDHWGRVPGLVILKVLAIALILLMGNLGLFEGYKLLLLALLDAWYLYVVYRNALLLH